MGKRIRVQLAGPEGSPFESANFSVDVDIGDEYPFKAPFVRFGSPRRVFHPNVCPRSGGICLDILNNSTLWSPAIGLEKLLLGIASLLSEPRTEHGLNSKALELLKRDPAAFAARASAAAAASGSSGVAASAIFARNTDGQGGVSGATAAQGGTDDGASAAKAEENTATEGVLKAPAITPAAAAKPAPKATVHSARVASPPEPMDLSGACMALVAAAFVGVVVAVRVSSQ